MLVLGRWRWYWIDLLGEPWWKSGRAGDAGTRFPGRIVIVCKCQWDFPRSLRSRGLPSLSSRSLLMEFCSQWNSFCFQLNSFWQTFALVFNPSSRKMQAPICRTPSLGPSIQMTAIWPRKSSSQGRAVLVRGIVNGLETPCRKGMLSKRGCCSFPPQVTSSRNSPTSSHPFQLASVLIIPTDSLLRTFHQSFLQP